MSEPAVPGRAASGPAPEELAAAGHGGPGAVGREPGGTEDAGAVDPAREHAAAEDTAAEDAAAEDVAPQDTAAEDAAPQGAPGQSGDAPAEEPSSRSGSPARRRRDRVAAVLIGVLTLLLGFAFAVQVRSTETSQQTSSAREEDLVRLLDNLNNQEERLRSQIADQSAALEQLTSSDSQSATALSEARSRAAAIGILNGTVAAQGPGLRMVIRDPEGSVSVADLLDAIEELRGAGAETMQIDGVRVGVDTAVTGSAGALRLDDRPLRAPYEVLVIGSPQDLETAMDIPGGVVQRITGQGGTVDIAQQQQVVVDALRPLQRPQYASPKSGG